MTVKPCRWFQIHLSTAIVLMFVAGGLVWANVRSDPPHWTPTVNATEGDKLLMPLLEVGKKFRYGWPFLAYHSDYNQNGIYSVVDGVDCYMDGTPKPVPGWQYKGVFWNLCVAVILLAITAILCEIPFRRREARKT